MIKGRFYGFLSVDDQTGDADDRDSLPANLEHKAGRRSLAAGLSVAAAAFLTACGKSVFGGESRKINQNPEGSIAAADSAGDQGVDKQTDPGADSGTTGGGNDSGTDGDSGSGNSDTGEGGGGGADGEGTEGESPNYGTENGLGACDGLGLSTVDTSKIATDDSIIGQGDGESFKLWGRDSSAMLAIKLASNTVTGATVLILKPSAGSSSMSEVLAVRQVLHALVDVTEATSLVLFENLALNGISKIIVVVMTPGGVSKKTEIDGISALIHPQSKRFAHSFLGKPVIDLQISMLESQEGLSASVISGMTNRTPIFGGSANGFGFDRNTVQAFRLRNLRTAGYLGAAEDETAHIAHSKSTWKCPSNLSSPGTVVTDLLERDITDQFVGSSTTMLKHDYNFVVYVPDNSAAPEHYYRYIVSVG